MAVTNWFGKNNAALPKPSLPDASGTISWKPPLSTSYQGTTTKQNTASKGSSGSYRGSSGSSGAPANPYSAILNGWYSQQQAAAEAAAAAKQAAAQEAYDRGMAALGNAYNSMLGNLQQNYDSSLGTLQDSYNSGVHGVNQQADKTQNEAYVNYMLTMRDMPQLLAAQGVNGGAAESTIAGSMPIRRRPCRLSMPARATWKPSGWPIRCSWKMPWHRESRRRQIPSLILCRALAVST